MKAIILPEETFQILVNRVDSINQKLDSLPISNSESFLDNNQFLERMKVSKRTAQSWRDEGLISFSQVGNKIYYKVSDIEKFLGQHYNKAFKKS